MTVQCALYVIVLFAYTRQHAWEALRISITASQHVVSALLQQVHTTLEAASTSTAYSISSSTITQLRGILVVIALSDTPLNSGTYVLYVTPIL
jgi:hypothetical protein